MALGFEAIDPSVTRFQVDQSKGITDATRTNAVTITDVHANSVKKVGRGIQEFTTVVTFDGGHITDSQRRISVVTNFNASTDGFQEAPVSELAGAEVSLQITSGHAFNECFPRVGNGVDWDNRINRIKATHGGSSGLEIDGSRRILFRGQMVDRTAERRRDGGS